jgi:hypothetical protein
MVEDAGPGVMRKASARFMESPAELPAREGLREKS